MAHRNFTNKGFTLIASVASASMIFGAAGLQLVRKQKFQLGFNRLFVFQKPQ